MPRSIPVLIIIIVPIVLPLVTIQLRSSLIETHVERFPHSLKPVFEVNITQITHDNYVIYLNYSYVLNAGVELQRWIEDKLSKKNEILLLEIKVYIENRGERGVTVYMGGCLGRMSVEEVYIGEYYLVPKICALALWIRGIPTGERISDVELLFVTKPAKISGIFETTLSTYCVSEECYKLKVLFDLTLLNESLHEVFIRDIKYIPVKPP